MADTKHYKLMRDDDRPLEFDGEQIAEVSLEDFGSTIKRAALYRTAGGKYVSEFRVEEHYVTSKPGEWEVTRAKVAHFNTIDEAAAWFRPGPLTTRLLSKLQNEITGEHIE